LRLSLQSLWLLGLFTLLLLALSGPARAQRGGEYQVTRATYGTSWQGMDVTQRVHQLAQQGGSFQVSNDLFGADPAPNQRKVLRVQIRGRDGRTQTAEFAESSWVSPSQLVDGYGGNGGYNPGGPGYGYLTIHRATYGDGYRQVDVTQRLRAYVTTGGSTWRPATTWRVPTPRPTGASSCTWSTRWATTASSNGSPWASRIGCACPDAPPRPLRAGAQRVELAPFSSFLPHRRFRPAPPGRAIALPRTIHVVQPAPHA